MTKNIFKFVKRLDLFGVEIPQLNLNGETQVKSSIGSIITIIIAILMFIFALIKLEHLANRKNPDLSSIIESIDEGEIYDLNEEDFMMAFTLEHWSTGIKNDTRYFQWVLQVSTSSAFNGGVQFYPMHRCTD